MNQKGFGILIDYGAGTTIHDNSIHDIGMRAAQTPNGEDMAEGITLYTGTTGVTVQYNEVWVCVSKRILFFLCSLQLWLFNLLMPCKNTGYIAIRFDGTNHNILNNYVHDVDMVLCDGGKEMHHIALSHWR